MLLFTNERPVTKTSSQIVKVAGDAGLPRDHAARADRRATGIPVQPGDHGVGAEAHVVADLDLIVELDRRPRSRCPRSCRDPIVVLAPISTSLPMTHAADLRDLQPVRPVRREAEAVGAARRRRDAARSARRWRPSCTASRSRRGAYPCQSSRRRAARSRDRWAARTDACPRADHSERANRGRTDR